MEQLDQYPTEFQHMSDDMAPAVDFEVDLLAPVVEDFVCSPASHAYVERICFCMWHSV